jgi:protein SCO1
MSPRESIHKRHFPDIVLLSHDGRTLRLYEDLIRDRIVTLNFMYINCEDGTCPLTTHNLAQVQKLLRPRVGRDIFMYSVTLDPRNDSAAALAKYARSHGAGPGWLFLKAEPRDTELLRRRLGFYSRDPKLDARKSTHAAMVRYGNEPKQLWGAVAGTIAPEAIVRQIRWVAPPGARA